MLATPAPSELGERLAAWARRRPAPYEAVVPLHCYDLSAATRGLDEPWRAWLTLDLATLLARYAGSTRAAQAHVSFGAVRGDGRREFDVVNARYLLACTYVGPGPMWAAREVAAREASLRSADCLCDEGSLGVRDTTTIRHTRAGDVERAHKTPNAPPIRHTRAGDVLLMKGSSQASRPGAVYRLPPLETHGPARVVLVAHTVDAP